jgi:hypothetical protein
MTYLSLNVLWLAPDDIPEPERPVAGSWYVDYVVKELPSGRKRRLGYVIKEVRVASDGHETFSYPFGTKPTPARILAEQMLFSVCLLRSMEIDRMVDRQKAALEIAKQAMDEADARSPVSLYGLQGWMKG